MLELISIGVFQERWYAGIGMVSVTERWYVGIIMISETDELWFDIGHFEKSF